MKFNNRSLFKTRVFLLIRRITLTLIIFSVGYAVSYVYNQPPNPNINGLTKNTNGVMGHIKSKYFDTTDYKYKGYYISRDILVSDMPTGFIHLLTIKQFLDHLVVLQSMVLTILTTPST